MGLSNAERQRRFIGKRRSDGLTKISIFVPTKLADEMRRYFQAFPDCDLPGSLIEFIGVAVRLSDGTLRTLRKN